VGSASDLNRAERLSNSFGLSGGAPGEQQVIMAIFFIDIHQCST
jgi:hypothetical protein